jgi:hypothetical protein
MPIDSSGVICTIPYDAVGNFFSDPKLVVDYSVRWLYPSIEYEAQGATLLYGPPEVLEDVQQDSMLKLCLRLRQPGFRAEQLVGLLYKIVHDEMVNVYRCRERAPLTLGSDALDALDGLDDDAHALRLSEHVQQHLRLDEAGWQQFLSDLDAEVVRLPACQREVALLYIAHYEQLSERHKYTQLAELMKRYTGEVVSPETIKSNWRAANRTLKERMRRRGYCVADCWFYYTEPASRVWARG